MLRLALLSYNSRLRIAFRGLGGPPNENSVSVEGPQSQPQSNPGGYRTGFPGVLSLEFIQQMPPTRNLKIGGHPERSVLQRSRRTCISVAYFCKELLKHHAGAEKRLPTFYCDPPAPLLV
jgi:hypothetical protein